MPSEEDRDQFDPELDLLNRYEQMIATQIEIINGIDDKAAFTGRLIGLLGGLILTAISVVAGTDTIESSGPTAALLALLAIGVLALFVSLVLAIITYLSSKFAYGPTAGLGKFMAEHQVDPQQYRDALLDGYSEAIVDNRRVVQRNARRFKYCLTALLVAVLYLFSAGTLSVISAGREMDTVVGLFVTVVAVVLSWYVLTEGYLTLEV